MNKIDMNALLAEVQAEIGVADVGREVARRKTYDALLVHVKDFEYLTRTQEPTAHSSGFLVFSVGSQFRLRVECNVKLYYLHSQDCPKGSTASKRWHGGHDEEDVTEVCKGIAKYIAAKLSGQADPEEMTE